VSQDGPSGWRCGENATYDILVDCNAEGQGELLSHSRATPVGITPFHFNDGVDEFSMRSFWAMLTPALGRKQHAVLSFRQYAVEMQQSRRLQDEGRPDQARSPDQESA
jgi:hypothetical protein